VYSASLQLTNTIVGANLKASRECELIGSVSATGAGNLVTNNVNCPGVASTDDPLLAPLAIEAPGNTPTMAIDDGSPAHDAGDDDTCEAADQRGVSRPRSLHCDIGAYEYVKPSANLSVSTSTLGSAVSGNDLAYLVQVDNHGPTAAENVSLSITLPATATFVSITGSGGFSCTGSGPVTCTKAFMSEGSTALLTLTVHLPSSMVNGTPVTESATVGSSTADPVPGNNSASVTATAATRADLFVSKAATPTVVAGTDVAYGITVTNLGPSDAQSVIVADTIPAGTTFRSVSAPSGWSCVAPAVDTPGPLAVSCSKASLAAGATAQIMLTIRLGAAAADGSQLCNTASASSSTADPLPSNNTSEACATVRTLADLSLAQTASKTGKPGKGTASFTFVVTNLGPSDSQTVSLTATSSLFSGPAPTTSATDGATCAVSGQTVTCSWARIAVGDTATVTISVPWRSAKGSVCTTGAVTAGTPDPNAVNDTAGACIGKK